MSSNEVKYKIIKASKGTVFFAEDFANITSKDNIRQNLSRLEKEGFLVRLAQGIYIKPQKDELLGVVYPKTDDIAKEIARRDKSRLVPTGIFALYSLGLTTQVPLKISYLTDGSQRDIKIGKSVIKFRKTAPKTFAIKNELLQLIVQACREIGQKNITKLFLQQLQPKVRQLQEDVLIKELKFAPVWIQKLINKLHKSSDNVD